MIVSTVFSTCPGRVEGSALGKLPPVMWTQGAEFLCDTPDWLEAGQPLGSQSGASCQSPICLSQSLKQSCQLSTPFLEMDSVAAGCFRLLGGFTADSPACPHLSGWSRQDSPATIQQGACTSQSYQAAKCIRIASKPLLPHILVQFLVMHL